MPRPCWMPCCARLSCGRRRRNSTGPDRILAPPKFCKLRCAQGSLFRGEKFIKLRWADFGGAQHPVRLTPVMNLMLKQVKQQPIDPLALNAIAEVDVDDTIEIGRVQALDDSNQSPVRLLLRISERDCSF